MNNVEVWLWILLVMLPHNPRTAELLRQYGSALDAARAMRDGECDILTEQEKKRAERTRTREVKALISECQRLDIRIVTLDDEEYPSLLKMISNPPIVLFVKGDLAPLSRIASVAVVGPRSSSEYGRKVSSVLCGDLAGNGVGIISGLAVGIDAAAHRAAVDCSGYTVGVLGCGITVNYPAENEDLKQTILEKGGAIISELLPTASVSSSYFKYRNRIISGMAMGALIIEASTRSGALLTAEHTFDQDKPVFVIPPHDIFEERFCGVFPLIKKGAELVSGVRDIYSVLVQRYSDDRYNVFSAELHRIERLMKKQPNSVYTKEQKAKPVLPVPIIKTPPKSSKREELSDKTFSDTDLSSVKPEYRKVVQLLNERSMTMDELIVYAEITHEEMCTLLLDMELDDIIMRNQDATYSLK